MRRLAALSCIWATGCSVTIDYRGAAFACSDASPVCPPGQVCMGGQCLAVGGPDADPALCGNGELDGGESCDDGNDVDTDLCTSGCRIAACGDGFVRESVEECDDGGADPAGACNALCRSCGAPQDFTWPTSGACYRRRDAPGLSWSIANARCGMTGAHLAVYESLEESGAVGTALAAPSGRWIGLSDQGTEGEWVWLTGAALDQAPWSASEPNGGQAENCVDQDESGGWGDFACGGGGLVDGFLCEDDGWLIGPDGHAYRYLFQEAVWTIARDACAQLGGHLVTIGSAAENTLVSSRVRREVFLGASDLAVSDEFSWVDGEPFAFEAWGGNAPNDPDGTEDCVTLDETGTWDDDACDVPRAYVCEVE